MRILAWILWSLALVWVVLALVGAENFQGLYGGTAGAQLLLLAFVTALVPAGFGWWSLPQIQGLNRRTPRTVAG